MKIEQSFDANRILFYWSKSWFVILLINLIFTHSIDSDLGITVELRVHTNFFAATQATQKH